MELKTAGIKTVRHPISKPKNRLMLSRQTINRLVIIGFMVLVGYCLAKAIYHSSVMGIILALVSLSAGIYFLYILAKAKEEMEAEEAV
jgi:general stress protein CsbA